MTGRLGHRLLLAILLGSTGGRMLAEDDVIRLPPMIVRAQAFGPTWYYASMPGFEILSSTRDGTTRHFAQQFYIQFLALREIVPAELQRQTSVPTALILLDEGHEHFLSAQMQAALGGAGVIQPHFRTPPQLRLFDDESTDFYFVLKDPDSYDIVGFGPDHVNFLLAARRPPLPGWFVLAVTRLYEQAQFRAGSTQFPAIEWLSPAETAALRRDPSHPEPLLPMADILADSHARSSFSPEKLRLWQAESTLFLRWAVENRGKGRLKSLWKLVEKTGDDSVSEDVFQDCFDLDFTDLQDRLRDYLPKAVNGSVTVAFSPATRWPTITPSPATPAQYLRLWGNWERMEIEFVKRRYPAYTASYIQRADDSFAEALKPGYGDTGALAVAGLYAAERGNNQAALPALAEAVEKHVERPGVYVELARLRFESARTAAAATGGKLGPEQVAEVMGLLQEARRWQPPLLATYLVATYTFLNSTGPISRENWSLLDEGRRFFPENAVLARGAADLAARAAR
jgi:hypothetical protein